MGVLSAISPQVYHALGTILRAMRSYEPDLNLAAKRLETAYHYTDLAGLVGIVQKHDLWLTHSRYCNDDEELLLGQRVAREVVRAERKTSDDVQDQAYLDALAELLRDDAAQGAYICCFCEQGDRLGQWRAYGANGTGVSLAFRMEEFSYMTGSEFTLGMSRLWKAIYDRGQQERIVHQAIAQGRHSELPDPAGRAKAAHEALQFFLPAFKNAGFDEEEEWRLIFTPAPDCPVAPAFRPGRGMLIPYYSLRALADSAGGVVPRLPLTEVRLGPGPNKSINAESARQMLALAGYERATVSASQIPYRA